MYVSTIQHKLRLTLTSQKDARWWSCQMSMLLFRNVQVAQRTKMSNLSSFVHHLVLEMVHLNNLEHGTSVILPVQHVFQYNLTLSLG